MVTYIAAAGAERLRSTVPTVRNMIPKNAMEWHVCTGDEWYMRVESALQKTFIWKNKGSSFYRTYKRQVDFAMREADAGEYEGCILIDFHFYWRHPIMLIGTKKAVLIHPCYVLPYADSYEFIIMKIKEKHREGLDDV